MAPVLWPVNLEEETTISGMFMGPFRCGATTCFGAAGIETLSGEPIRVVAFEWPTSYAPTGHKATKELQHLSRFNVDFRAGTGRELYGSIVPVSSDPPDFLCMTQDGDARGVECTQLVVESRLGAEARFRRLRMRILGTNRHRFQHLHGYVVYVAFWPLGSSPPPKVQEIASALSTGLEQHDPTIGTNETELAPQAPEGLVTRFPGGTIGTAPLNSDPGTMFSRTMGFELALSNATTVRETDAWAQFERLVRDHDSQGVDDIVISAEAPTTDGFAYPSDAVLSQAVIEHGSSTALTTRHAKSIYLHGWSTQGVFKFTPEKAGVEQICGGLPFGPSHPDTRTGLSERRRVKKW